VKTHVSAVIQTLGVTNRTEAAGLLADLSLGSRAEFAPAESGVPGFGERPVIAMLPFEDVADAPDGGWFARGL
jgi:hypothetical protein